MEDSIVYIKEDFTWHFVSMYLNCLTNTVVCQDEEFMRLFQQLHDYVDDKIFIECAGDVTDISVIVARKAH